MSITTMHARLDKLATMAPAHDITELVMLDDSEPPPPGSVPLGPDAWLMPDQAPGDSDYGA